MAVYAYTALDRNGRRMSGTVPADTRAAAMDHVIGQGLSPVSIEERGGGGNGKAAAAAAKKMDFSAGGKAPPTRVPRAALEDFTRELANLLAGGLSLSKALHLLRREASQPAAKYIWSQVHDDVVGGVALGDAMAKWPRVFSTVYVAMVQAGEAGGFLHVVLQQISDFRTREQDLKGKVKAAMVYPIVLACLAVAVLIFLLTFFIPRFAPLFDQFGGKLPALTQVIIALSHWLKSYGWIMAIALAAGIFFLRNALTSEAGRRFLERVMLNTPVLGTVAARFALIRFCRMLGTLLGSGVPLVNSLKVAKEALGNQTLADAVGTATEEVRRGVALSRSLSSNSLLFPPSVIEMISVAEETGRLDKELVRLSIAYESDLDRNLRMLVSLAEPLLLILMAGLIGTVVVGMLLPIFSLQDLVK